MKFLAIGLALILQATGAWPHVSPSLRSAVVARTGTQAQGQSAQPTAVAIAPIPVKTGTEPLAVAAPGVYAADMATDLPLFSQHANSPRPIASVTKMVTAIVILSRHQTTELVTVGKLPAYDPSDELMGLREGEVYSVGDLIKAALIPSYNDAADALAIYDAGSITKFAARMNLKMSQWGIEGTRFVSATGLTDDGNYATPLALSKIGKLALVNPIIAQTVRMQTATITSTSGRTFNLTTTNKLLATGLNYGIKTGYTGAAGECFVGLTHVAGHDVITVVLGSGDRFSDTQTLLNWIGRNYQWL